MLLFTVKRLLHSIVALFIIITITFFLMHAVPGNIYTGERKLPDAVIENIEEKYGLDRSLLKQYITMLDNVIHFDFGMSMSNTGRKVNDIINQHFPVSVSLGLLSLIISITGGVFFGVLIAMAKGKWSDILVMLFSTPGMAIPVFIVAAIFQYYLSVRLDIFPATGFETFAHALLPAISLSLYPLAFIARLTGSEMSDVLKCDYIMAARAKGMPERTVIFKHALKNAVIPVITYMGPLMAFVFTGSFVVEKIFSIPGLGRYFVNSISNRDYTVIMGVTVFYAAVLILSNFIVDIVYSIIDPRIKMN